MGRTIKGIYLIWVTIHLSIALIFSDGIMNSHNWDDGYKDFFSFINIGSNPDMIYDEEAHIKSIINKIKKNAHSKDDNSCGRWFNECKSHGYSLCCECAEKVENRLLIPSEVEKQDYQKPNPNAGFYIEYMSDIKNYDITEFLFYLIAPVLLYFSYQFIRPKSGENK